MLFFLIYLFIQFKNPKHELEENYENELIKFPCKVYISMIKRLNQFTDEEECDKIC